MRLSTAPLESLMALKGDKGLGQRDGVEGPSHGHWKSSFLQCKAVYHLHSFGSLPGRTTSAPFTVFIPSHFPLRITLGRSLGPSVITDHGTAKKNTGFRKPEATDLSGESRSNASSSFVFRFRFYVLVTRPQENVPPSASRSVTAPHLSLNGGFVADISSFSEPGSDRWLHR